MPRAPRQQSSTKTPSLSPFRTVSEQLERPPSEEPPILIAVARRLRHKGLNKKIRITSNSVLQSLHKNKNLWLELEQLQGRRAVEVEEAFFNVGYENGLAAGRVEALRSSSSASLSKPARKLAEQTRSAIVQAGLASHEAVAILLETAWSILLPPPTKPQLSP